MSCSSWGPEGPDTSYTRSSAATPMRRKLPEGVTAEREHELRGVQPCFHQMHVEVKRAKAGVQ